jgi:CubicO group peptidase (beta-lactamase class C family)
MMNLRYLQEACIPATSGVLSARALARHYAALLPGGVDGVELLTPEQVKKVTTFGASDPADTNHVLGYGFQGDRPPLGQPVTTFGHGGHGGSNGYANTAHHYAVGYTRNRFDDGAVPLEIFEAIAKALA